MPVIESKLDPRGATFAGNRDAMTALVADLRTKIAEVEEGGGAGPRAKHAARGKLLPRERVRALVDPGSPFLEFSQLAAYGMYGDNIASAGIIPVMRRMSLSNRPGPSADLWACMCDMCMCSISCCGNARVACATSRTESKTGPSTRGMSEEIPIKSAARSAA